MARQKLSEFKAKKILSEALSLSYTGVTLTSSSRNSLHSIDPLKRYVLKVDQGIKKRMKQGLIFLDLSLENINEKIKVLEDKGFTQFLIEEYIIHERKSEKYLSIQRDREGMYVTFSNQGGIDVEDNKHSIESFYLDDKNINQKEDEYQLPAQLLRMIVECMNAFHISFLEINPLVIDNKNIFLLDLAMEVDDAGEFFVKGKWTHEDFVTSEKNEFNEEKKVALLNTQSQAAFSLNVLNPNGSLFMLLSGGGASIVIADEVYNRGHGHLLANYGEYSGNPNEEETYLYTLEILSLLFSSKAQRKALIIAGGVANFTDIRITFQGIMRALSEHKSILRKENVKIFVRRGGPYQKQGLENMEKFLENEGLLGQVAGPEMILSEIVKNALKEVESQ